MRSRFPAALAVLFALPAHGATARVEVVPGLGRISGAPSVSAPLAAPAFQAPLALAPAMALAAPSLTPVLAAQPVAAAAVKAAQPQALLVTTLAAPALDVSKLSTGGSGKAAEADFNARAQLDAPASIGDAVAAAPAASEHVPKPRLALVPSAKRPAPPAARAAAGSPLDLIAAPQSLRAMAERGESRRLIQSSDGRWGLSERESSDAYPTSEEIEAAAGKPGRFFVASRHGLVEWNPVVPEGAAAALRSKLSLLAARVPALRGSVLAYHGVAVRRTSWTQAIERGLAAGEAPVNEHVLISKTIPAFIAHEFPVVAAKLGRKVDAAYAADVLKRSNGYRMHWHSATTYKDHPDHVGIPDGHFRHDFGIRLMVKPDWRRLKDLSANYRPLYAHEYVHWLQNEGFVSNRYGAEIPAVAVEVLRAIELVGLDAVRAGRAGTVHPGVLSSFDGGREWARAGFKNDTTAYSKGALAGAAYEAGVAAGRPEAAWEFLNLVIAGKGALEPGAAWARAVGAK